MRLTLALAVAAITAIATEVAAGNSCTPSAGLSYICGVLNAEDLVQVQGTPWIIASGMAEGNSLEGRIHLTNTSSRTVQMLLPGNVTYEPDTTTYATCPGKPDETMFSAHGIALRDGQDSKPILYVVRHGEREAVEVFKLQTGADTPTLTWIGCVPYPDGVFGNAVAPLPGGGFVASNFISTNDPDAIPKLLAAKPQGGMLIWRPGQGWEDIPEAAGISADNGVATSPGGQWMFVAGSADQTIVRLAVKGSPRERKIIKIDFHPDNLRWGSDGFLYATGQRDTLENLMACAPNTPKRCTSPFSVLRIDPATLETHEVFRHPGGLDFGVASSAILVGNDFWFGTPHGDRIAIAPLK